MEKTIRFFKQDNMWYADVAGHTMAENQMVDGSDDFLEFADRELGGRGEVIVTLSTAHDPSCGRPVLARLDRCDHDSCGATYELSGLLAKTYSAVGFRLWICNVTHDVLGEHPESIFVYSIK